MTSDVTVQGEVGPGFEPVRDAFASNWQRIEVGASRCFTQIEFAATQPFELDVAENQVPSPPNCGWRPRLLHVATPWLEMRNSKSCKRGRKHGPSLTHRVIVKRG